MFRGWQPEAVEFYERLAADNRREFWLEHKPFWQEQVRRPFERLDADVRDGFGPLHHFRPNRDVRFSKDKSPYKTHHGAVTEGEGGAMYYVHLDAEGLFVATGYYQMARDQLERFRRAIDDDTTGGALVEALEALGVDRELDLDGVGYKRVPKPYAADHPRAELLKHKAFQARWIEPTPATVTEAAFVDHCVERLEACADVHRWLVTNL